jgi:hypothetical protein
MAVPVCRGGTLGWSMSTVPDRKKTVSQRRIIAETRIGADFEADFRVEDTGMGLDHPGKRL